MFNKKFCNSDVDLTKNYKVLLKPESKYLFFTSHNVNVSL